LQLSLAVLVYLKTPLDRALNWQVWQHLVAALPRATPQQPLRVLEVGAGIGSMVERFVADVSPLEGAAVGFGYQRGRHVNGRVSRMGEHIVYALLGSEVTQ
jgi:hypothetical protein